MTDDPDRPRRARPFIGLIALAVLLLFGLLMTPMVWCQVLGLVAQWTKGKTRLWAVEELGTYGPRAVPVLINVGASADEQGLKDVRGALWTLANSRKALVCLPYMSSKNRVVRSLACETVMDALENNNDREVVDPLNQTDLDKVFDVVTARFSKEGDREILEMLSKSLACHDARVIPMLLKHGRNPLDGLRYLSLLTLRMLLSKLRKAEDKGGQKLPVEGPMSEALKHEELLPTLFELYRGEDRLIEELAKGCLRHIGRPALMVAGEGLSSDDLEERRAFCKYLILESRTFPEVNPKLLELCLDPEVSKDDFDDYWEALVTVSDDNFFDVYPRFEKLLLEDDDKNSYKVTTALREMPSDKEAYEVLGEKRKEELASFLGAVLLGGTADQRCSALYRVRCYQLWQFIEQAKLAVKSPNVELRIQAALTYARLSFESRRAIPESCIPGLIDAVLSSSLAQSRPAMDFIRPSHFSASKILPILESRALGVMTDSSMLVSYRESMAKRLITLLQRYGRPGFEACKRLETRFPSLRLQPRKAPKLANGRSN